MCSGPFGDGSAGDADYGAVGTDYARYRQPDPDIARHILAAIGDAHTVLNVGAGAGSYEPRDREVIAVEPSATMRAQRPPDLPAAIDAVAENLPFPDLSFDAAMAISSVHQWVDLPAGIGELVRVTRGPIVILTSDPAALRHHWLAAYLPELLAIEARRFPAIDTIVSLLGGAEVRDIPIPLTCTDGFEEAYYGRPELLLDPGVQRAISTWSFLAPEANARFMHHLAVDLASGAWDRKYGYLRSQPTHNGALRLIIRP
ncbi:MAG TPA: class I SAM-dependent methyltransferase [Thermomicrobiales bacterium]|nr:class I SAM-dependent methyltransferase [Thermomicrobiales bacterium]